MYHLFMDLETTERYATEWNNIIEIAGIVYDIENDLEIDRFHKLCYPKSGKISEGASEVTGYTIKMLKQYEDEEDVLLEFAAWVGLHKMDGNIAHIVGHNYEAFDHNVISKRMGYFGIVWPFADTRDNIIDTYKHAKGVKSRGIPKRIEDTGFRTESGKSVSYTQESIAKFYGIKYDAHHAIDDILALIQIFKRMFNKVSVKEKRSKLGF